MYSCGNTAELLVGYGPSQCGFKSSQQVIRLYIMAILNELGKGLPSYHKLPIGFILISLILQIKSGRN